MSRLSEMLEQLDSEALAKCTGTTNESECFDRFVTAKQMEVENYHPLLSQLSPEMIAFIGVAGCLVIILHIFFPVRKKAQSKKMKPDAKHHNPAPDYIRELVLKTGLTREEIAARLGISLRTLDNYRSESSGYTAPYTVQYCLEQLSSRSK